MFKRATKNTASSQPLLPGKRQKLTAAPVKGAAPRAPRTLVIGMGSIISMLILLLIIVAWGAGMTFMLLTGDRLAQRLIVQNSEMQDAYEQRLQAFRAEIARLTLESEQSKFDQNSVEGRVIELGKRQRQIDSRLQILSRLSELVAPGALNGSGQAPRVAPQPANVPTPPVKNGTSGALEAPFVAPFARGAVVAFDDQSRVLPGLAQEGSQNVAGNETTLAQLDALLPDTGREVAQLEPDSLSDQPTSLPPSESEIYIERLNKALSRSEQASQNVLGTMSRLSEQRVERLRGAMEEIGMSAQDVMTAHLKGGEAAFPAVVLSLSEQNTPFAASVGKIHQNFQLLHKIQGMVDSLPLYKPTVSELRYSSPFGFRVHPITGVLKLHAGIDVAAPIGTPVKAAGSGVVLSASWGGGYGNLIQIDHGNGLISRYAHLSEIDVTAGQPVSAGMFIGKVGTTGASTGPHLHFETRIDGTPNNPACFMLAGEMITGLTSMPFPCDKRPVWGRHTNDEEDDSDT